MTPPRLLVTFGSWNGHCAIVAERLAAGARDAGADVLVRKVDAIRRADIGRLDGLAIGSPVHQRTMSWPVKKFIDEICEPAPFYDELVGRASEVFTTGGGHGDAGGGCEMAQPGLLANLAACGCVLVPFAKVTRGFDVAGMHWGPHVRITGEDMVRSRPTGCQKKRWRARSTTERRSRGSRRRRSGRRVRCGCSTAARVSLLPRFGRIEPRWTVWERRRTGRDDPGCTPGATAAAGSFKVVGSAASAVWRIGSGLAMSVQENLRRHGRLRSRAVDRRSGRSTAFKRATGVKPAAWRREPSW